MSADGERFLMIRRYTAEGEDAPRLILVQNFFEELKRFVPNSVSRQIPWLRVFVEGVVIVGSILFAFGI